MRGWIEMTDSDFHPALGVMCSKCNKALALMFAPNLEAKNTVREFLINNHVYVLCPDCAMIPKFGEEDLK